MFSCKICGKELPTKSGLTTHERYCQKLPQWLREVDDDGKVRSKYINKKVNAKAEGLICELTLEQFCNLMKQANIKSSQLGFTGDNYVLARYNDLGNYTYGNCRFIKQSENAKERKTSEKSRKASSKNIKEVNYKLKQNPELRNRIIEKRKAHPYNIKRHQKALEKQAIIDANKDMRYCKEHNSQYGTYWITNGINNMKWKDSKGPIPDTYYKGRICN